MFEEEPMIGTVKLIIPLKTTFKKDRISPSFEKP